MIEKMKHQPHATELGQVLLVHICKLSLETRPWEGSCGLVKSNPFVFNCITV